MFDIVAYTADSRYLFSFYGSFMKSARGECASICIIIIINGWFVWFLLTSTSIKSSVCFWVSLALDELNVLLPSIGKWLKRWLIDTRFTFLRYFRLQLYRYPTLSTPKRIATNLLVDPTETEIMPPRSVRSDRIGSQVNMRTKWEPQTRMPERLPLITCHNAQTRWNDIFIGTFAFIRSRFRVGIMHFRVRVLFWMLLSRCITMLVRHCTKSLRMFAHLC